MKSSPRLLQLIFALFACGVSLRAEVRPAPLFQNNAVLQRDKPVPVWGTAEPGEQVSITFGTQTKSTHAGADGRWMVTLDPLAASVKPGTLILKASNTLTLNNILVGDVWLASGQSNMEFIVRRTNDATVDVAASANPLIRHIKIEQRVADEAATNAKGAWEIATPKTTGVFSAVAYYFARDVVAATGIPVGIVNASVSGSQIEAWLDPDTLKAPVAADVRSAWAKTLEAFPARSAEHIPKQKAWEQAKAKAEAEGQPFTTTAPYAPPGPGHKHTPASLFNGMVNPVVPAAICGVLWYQGEQNAVRAAQYRTLFPAMISGWRAKFAQGDIPFYWVQLANFAADEPQGTRWAFLREAQANALSLPKTGQVVAMDVGDVSDIHPRNKVPVGRRLARIALARHYGFKVIDNGPRYLSAAREGAGFRVKFEPYGKLRAPLNALVGFELAGEDKVFRPAQAKLERDTVLVTSPEVTAPVAVRYAWRNAPEAGLFNDDGLPAAPFRTDNW